jgi:8-oxo-dGTP pyrophosphatase MutT (NUDIX family)
VATIALTPDNQVVVVRQFRAAPESVWYELPGGGVEDGEDIEAAAKRELFEETGYQPTAITYLGANTIDGLMNGVCHSFLATGCVSVGDPARDQTEIDQGVETVLISIDQLIENAKTNQMTDAVAVLMAYDTLKELQGGKI